MYSDYFTESELVVVRRNSVNKGWVRSLRIKQRDLICSKEGCFSVSSTKGMCSSHYQASKRAEIVYCNTDGCSKRLHSEYREFGFCLKHYRRVIGVGRWFYLRNLETECICEGCKRKVHARGYCKAHYVKHILPTTENGKIGIERRKEKGRFGNSMSKRIYQSLSGRKRYRKWESLVGYTLEDLKSHLEAQFTIGMDWDSYGIFGWHLDHIIPQSAFNFRNAEDLDFKRCWALNNLQPLWWYDNCVVKKDKLDKPFQPSLAISEICTH